MAINVIGAGLAGCEAAWQIAKRGVAVRLFEMRPKVPTAAHTTADFAELVCSNSLGSLVEHSAPGLLKQEMSLFDSLIISMAHQARVPAGGALAVDRDLFANNITKKLAQHPLVEIINSEVTELPEGVTIIATGPLSSPGMTNILENLTNTDSLYFYDAAAPIVTGSSIDTEKGFWAARYDRGDADYFNCPLTYDEYEEFWSALTSAEEAPLSKEDAAAPEGVKVFEGCMPVEVLARRGRDSLRYGPFKPVGLQDKTGKRPYAVLQLRKENTKATLFNLVGCQTRLKWGEQKRVFQLIPALAQAEFVRFGVMHRNTFVNSPQVLNAGFQFKEHPRLFLAGQVTGVEGYVESAASGMLAGINAVRFQSGRKPIVLPEETMIGALSSYISTADPKHFQPMNANFGIVPPLEEKVRGKQQRKAAYADRGLRVLKEYLRNNEVI